MNDQHALRKCVYDSNKTIKRTKRRAGMFVQSEEFVEEHGGRSQTELVDSLQLRVWQQRELVRTTMSNLTLSLLRRKPSRQAKTWQTKMRKVTALLVAEYGTPSLGNFRDPVKEIFYIVLSARTTESLYKEAHKRLSREFSSLEAIANAPVAKLRKCVATAGLGKKRAAQIKAIASKLLSDFGPRPGGKLRRLSAEDAYAYLRSLPGVGPKSALCVMMYSLGFDVFPVDAHAHRVLCRIGLIKPGVKHYHAQDVLPGFVPSERSKELHVALVVHGRRVCKPRSPSCEFCAIQHLCRYASSLSTPLHSGSGDNVACTGHGRELTSRLR